MSTVRNTPVLLINTRDAARVLAISPRSLWALTASREIPHVRIGRSVRYRISALESFLDQKEKEHSL